MEKLTKAGGNWVDGERFFNREVEVEALVERIREGRHTLLTAQRRMGKTSLVRETLRCLKDTGEFETLFVDLEAAGDPMDAVAEIATGTSSAQGLWPRVKRGFGNFLQQASIEELAVSELKVKIRAGVDKGNWKQKGDAIFASIDKHEKPVVLALDELPLLINRLLKGSDYRITPERKQDADEFMSWLRKAGQAHRNIRMIVFGSIGLEPTLRLAGLSAQANIFAPFELGPWDEDTASQCLKALANNYGIVLAPDLREAMCRKLRCCIPHHIQQFFDYLHEDFRRTGKQQATLDDIKRVYAKDMLGIRGRIDLEHYEGRLKMALGNSDYRIAMELLTEAAVNNGFLDGKSIEDYMTYYRFPERDDQIAIRDILRLLEHDGYLSRSDGGYRFVSGLLEDWWRVQNGDRFRSIADRLQQSKDA